MSTPDRHRPSVIRTPPAMDVERARARHTNRQRTRASPETSSDDAKSHRGKGNKNECDGMRVERFANCRVHKNCAHEWCEFKRLPWEFRAVREWNEHRTATRGRNGVGRRVNEEDWCVNEAKKEDAAWNEEGEKERKRLRLEEAKATRQADKDARLAVAYDRRLTTADANRMRSKMGMKGLNAQNSLDSLDSTTSSAQRRAIEVYENRMKRCRGLLLRRAMALARADTVAVHPVTNEVLYKLTQEQVMSVLKQDRFRQERAAMANTGPRVPNGPKVGDMYRLPKLYEEIWLYEDPALGDDDVTDGELLELLVDMHTTSF